MRELLDIIWKAEGYRFWHRRTTKDSGLIYKYYCSQDSSRDVGSTGKGKRDARRMERFQCKSKLRLRPCLEDRTLTITLYHLYHAPYVDTISAHPSHPWFLLLIQYTMITLHSLHLFSKKSNRNGWSACCHWRSIQYSSVCGLRLQSLASSKRLPV